MGPTAMDVLWKVLEVAVGLLVAIGGFVMRDVIARVRDLERSNHGERLAALEASHAALLRGQERQENALQEVDRKVGELLRYLVPHRDRS